MIRSMTGFVSKTITLYGLTSKTDVAITIKSLNSRFFEATCKLSSQLSNLEIDITKHLKEALLRGHIYYTLYVSNSDAFKGALEPSLNTVASYLQATQKIKDAYPSIGGNLSLQDVLFLPHVFITQENIIDDTSKNHIMETTHALIKELIQEQEKEGIVLKTDIEKNISHMQKSITIIEESSATLIETQKEKINKTMQEVTPDESSLNEIQKHAAYVLLDKMDINEEIVRFKSHLDNLSSTLNASTIEKGKRLDFTLQEMGREINTIAAKCSDATISSHAINIKVALEKAREQTQNIV